LSLMYDPKSIAHIRETLESSGGESTGYALELLDLLVADDIKPILFPLFDDITDTDKIKQLQDYYPLDRKKYISTLFDILNRDYNQLSLWTKACAINELENNEFATVPDELVALCFHPDPLLCQMATKILSKLDITRFEQVYQRLPETNQVTLKPYIENKNDDKIILHEDLITILKSVDRFHGMPGKLTYLLIDHLTNSNWKEDFEITNKNDDIPIILWPVTGEIKVRQSTKEITCKKGEFYNFYPESPNNIQAMVDSAVFTISKNDFETLLFDYPALKEYLVEKTEEVTR
jgi:ATP:ADP antiporter, AAA family